MLRISARLFAMTSLIVATLLPLGASAQFAGINGQILYSKFNSGGTSSELRAINADGTGDRQLVASIGNPNGGFSTSADGTSVAFATTQNGIFTAKLDGSSTVNVPNSVSGDSNPVWSLDGTKIYFLNSYSVYVTNIDGSGRAIVQAAAGTINYYSIAMSPDGTTLAVKYDDSSTPTVQNIETIPVAGGAPTPIVAVTGTVSSLDYSPDGSKILYTSHEGSTTNISTVLATGVGAPVVIITTTSAATGDAEYLAASWSPDGAAILGSTSTMTSATVDTDPSTASGAVTLFTVGSAGTSMGSASAALSAAVPSTTGAVWTTVKAVVIAATTTSGSPAPSLPKAGSLPSRSLPIALLSLGLLTVGAIEVIGRVRRTNR